VPETAFNNAPVLEGKGLAKVYRSVVALDDVDFALYRNEILAVIGENGSGKSTLIKCLTGAVRPDAGEVRLEGRRVRFRKPADARLAGINTVYQTMQSAPALDMATSLFRNHEVRTPGPLGQLSRRLEDRGLRKPPRALDSKVIVLDEPTATLGRRESARAMKFIDNLRGRGLPIVFVTHDVVQAFEIADRIHVQLRGRRAAVIDPRTIGREDAAALMSGALEIDEKDQAFGPLR
jgi:fructose transport system ATP-binding protein